MSNTPSTTKALKASPRFSLALGPYCARHTSVSWNLMIGKKPR